MKRNKVILCISILIVVLVVSLVYFLELKKRPSYYDYSNNDNYYESNVRRSNQMASEWIEPEIDLISILYRNDDILSGFGIEYTSLTERDFYNSVDGWDASVISKDGVPYKIFIDKEGSLEVFIIEGSGSVPIE